MAKLGQALRDLVRWAAGPRAQQVPRWWLHCPICDEELVGPFPSGAILPGPVGPSIMEPTREEVIAKCPTHGRAPYNDPDTGPGPRPVGDVDVLILGEPDRDALFEATGTLESRLGRPIQVTIRNPRWLETGSGSFHDTVVGRPLVEVPLRSEPSLS